MHFGIGDTFYRIFLVGGLCFGLGRDLVLPKSRKEIEFNRHDGAEWIMIIKHSF